MGGGKGGSKTTGQAAPWTGQQPFLSSLYDRAKNWSDVHAPGFSGTGGFPQFNTVAGFTLPEQMGQMSMLRGALSGGQQAQQAGTALQQQLSPDQDPLLQQAMMAGAPTLQQLSGLAGSQGVQRPSPTQGTSFSPINLPQVGGNVPGQQAPGVQDITSLAAQGQVPGFQQAVQGMLSGQPNMDVWGPVMEEAMRLPVQAFQEEVMPAIGRGAQQAGQYGGSRQGIAEGIAAGRLGETLGGMQTNLAAQAAREALQQQQAGGQLALGSGQLGLGMGQLGLGAAELGVQEGLQRGQLGLQEQMGAGQLGLGLGGLETQRAGTLGGLNLGAQQLQEASRGTDIGTALSAAGQLGQQFGNIAQIGQQGRLGALGLAPQVQQMGLFPGQVQQQVGGQQRAMQQAQIEEQIQRHHARQQGILPVLQQYAQLLGQPIVGQTQMSHRGSPLAGGLGGALTGASIGGIGTGTKAGATFGPWGAAIGAGLGGLAGLFM